MGPSNAGVIFERFSKIDLLKCLDIELNHPQATVGLFSKVELHFLVNFFWLKRAYFG